MEIKTTLKNIKAFPAVDISDWTFDRITALIRGAGSFRHVAYSVGIYGVNGQVIDVDGRFYKVVGRCGALFLVM